MIMEKEYYFIYNGDFSFVSGDYKWFPEIMENLGGAFEDYKSGKYVLLNEEQVSFLNEHSGATPEEVWNMSISDTATPEDIARLTVRIEDYYSSDNVKTFFVNYVPVWFNSEKRSSLNSSLSIEKALGRETTTLWINNISYTVPINTVEQMLADIEMYSSACYNNAQTIIAEAKTLTSRSDIEDFNITKGYPDKLNFNI